MMKPKIVLAGGTGFIGDYLSEKFRQMGYEVLVISRNNPHILWQQKDKIIEALENAEMLINLAGKSVDCRYNETNKALILSSRINSTKQLCDAIATCKNPPELFINSGTATIYRHAEDKPMTEDAGEIGEGFSVNIAKAWEKEFFSAQFSQTRQVVLRMSIVLGNNGGAILPLKRLVKFRLGGKQGDGNQMFSWIHIEDLLNIILFVKENKELNGVFNCSSPNPVDNREFMKEMRHALKVNFGLSSPNWLLQIGAFFIRTETELILKSRWVIPERLLKDNFVFKYPKLKDALGNILAQD